MRPANRLAGSTSPYLLQHAHNPVDWHPWAPEALSRARSEDRPILLSIGYAACHWCHVMERESFENEAIAALMNQHFVCIKVDREERPDLDDLYMAATLAMNDGQGGWPMTVFLTPALEPLYAGTYFPPEDRWGRPGFPTLLRSIARAWEERREELRAHGAEVMVALARAWEVGASRGGLEALLPRAVSSLTTALDGRSGGFGGAPKFPPHSALSLLHRAAGRGDGVALHAARLTLDGILRGGIHDQIGGGFSRYAVDAQWLVPHFEKMLTDNALLLAALTRSFALGREPRDREAIESTVEFLERELLLPEGGFASSLDADSEGEEGRFYVWTPEQVHQALGDETESQLACAYWDITTTGHLDGRAVPNLLGADLETFARTHGVSPDQLAARVDGWRQRLLATRGARVRPGLDDKVIAGWNGLTIGALAEAGRVLDQPHWIELAARAAHFVLATLRLDGGVLARSWRRGTVAPIPAFLDDFAFLADGLVDLAEAGGGPVFLDHAANLAAEILDRFAHPETGALLTTPHDGEELPARPRESHDGALPAAPAIAARALARLADHFDRNEWRVAARRAIEVDGNAATGFPRGFCSAIEVADRLSRGAVEVAIVGDPALDTTRRLQRVVASFHLPDRALAVWHPQDRPSDRQRPLLLDRFPSSPASAAAFVCRRGVCSPPIEDPDALSEALTICLGG